MIGDLIKSCCLILGMFSIPPCFTSIKSMRPLYIIPSLLLSFKALCSYSPMHLKYAFFNENVSLSNMSYGSWVTILGVHFGRPHIFFWIVMIY